ncbi:MAG: helix-turn-helix transcriptional regulator [Clostridia bacterium]|nr:helix-turn-helix transcriptional regulator [Clostridia bacterium]
MKTINDVVVEKLNKYMGERGLSQYKLAHTAGIPVPTIKGIMQKRTTNITLKTIILICNALKLPQMNLLMKNFAQAN